MYTTTVPLQARKYFEYDMIQNYTELPRFPHIRVSLLNAFLKKTAEGTRKYSDLLPLVTSLIQVGLDTHDMVQNAAANIGGKGDRTTQMRVLAGDYYSSRFYQLLANAGQIERIKILSNAICEVNRLKVSLYERMKQLKLTAEEYLRQSVKIKSALFMSFAQVFEGTYKVLWPEILEDYTELEVLAEELERAESMCGFHQSWGYWYLLQNGVYPPQGGEEHTVDCKKLKQLIHAHELPARLRVLLSSHLRRLTDKLSHHFDADLADELAPMLKPYMNVLSESKVLNET